MSLVRESAEFIASKSRNVQINPAKCKEAARKIEHAIVQQNYTAAKWSSHPLNPSATTPGVVDWIFTVDTLNFSFWQDEPRFTVSYNGELYTGYWSLVAMINRALDEGIPITTPSFWLSDDFDEEMFRYIARSETDAEIPMLGNRVCVLREAARALKKERIQSFEEVVRGSGHSALQVVEWVTTHIPSYADTAVYECRIVYLYKRAQILAADIWGCFQGKGLGRFDDINEITMFADYRVPQILYALGCIEYSPELYERVMLKRLLPSGSTEEVEIRGCSIWAVELIVREVPGLNAVLADFYLWDTAKVDEPTNQAIVEAHHTRSVYY